MNKCMNIYQDKSACRKILLEHVGHVSICVCLELLNNALEYTYRIIFEILSYDYLM